MEVKNFKSICKDFIIRNDTENLIDFIKLNVDSEKNHWPVDYVETNYNAKANYQMFKTIDLFDKYGNPNLIELLDLTNEKYDFSNNFEEIITYLSNSYFHKLTKIILPKIENNSDMENFIKKFFENDKINKFPSLVSIDCSCKITECTMDIIYNHFYDYTYLKRNHVKKSKSYNKSYNESDNESDNKSYNEYYNNFTNGYECFVKITNTQIREFNCLDYYQGWKTGEDVNVLVGNSIIKCSLKIKGER